MSYLDHVNAQQLNLFRSIKLLACDVDGVFSDGRIYMGNDGEELKAFHTRDGYGLKAIMSLGIEVAIITGRRSAIVQNRMSALGVKHIIQGEEDKGPALKTIQAKLGIAPDHTASIGDDMPDTAMYQYSKLAISVADGHPLVKQQAGYVTQTPGGFGAVREVCDLILLAHQQLGDIHGASV